MMCVHTGEEVPQDDPCQSCWCYNDGDVSELMCAVMDCVCQGHVIQDDTCCGICEPGCFENDQFYPEGMDIHVWMMLYEKLNYHFSPNKSALPNSSSDSLKTFKL